ncbi:MAG: hypothetical protein NTW16_00225 [Bacteroidetes bacterium]|nr:hypothetical protein [Bacteroidota bacterium]
METIKITLSDDQKMEYQKNKLVEISNRHEKEISDLKIKNEKDLKELIIKHEKEIEEITNKIKTIKTLEIIDPLIPVTKNTKLIRVFNDKKLSDYSNIKEILTTQIGEGKSISEIARILGVGKQGLYKKANEFSLIQKKTTGKRVGRRSKEEIKNIELKILEAKENDISFTTLSTELNEDINYLSKIWENILNYTETSEFKERIEKIIEKQKIKKQENKIRK